LAFSLVAVTSFSRCVNFSIADLKEDEEPSGRSIPSPFRSVLTARSFEKIAMICQSKKFRTQVSVKFQEGRKAANTGFNPALHLGFQLKLKL